MKYTGKIKILSRLNENNFIKFVSNFNPIMQTFQGFTQHRIHSVNYELQIQNKTKRSAKFYLNKHGTYICF